MQNKKPATAISQNKKLENLFIIKKMKVPFYLVKNARLSELSLSSKSPLTVFTIYSSENKSKVVVFYA